MNTTLNAYFDKLDQVQDSDQTVKVWNASNVIVDDNTDVDDFQPKALVANTFTRGNLPPVAVTYDVTRKQWKLLSNYKLNLLGSLVTIRSGFEFDLSSIPRAFWSIVAPNELSLVAPLFHDYLYTCRGEAPKSDVTPYRAFTRKEADGIFLHLMELEGVSLWRRNVAYRAVRMAGGVYWNT